MLGGVLASVVLVAALFGILKWRSEEFDRTTMISLSVGVLLLWIIPWGIFIIIPIALGISLSSPAGRDESVSYTHLTLPTILLV